MNIFESYLKSYFEILLKHLKEVSYNNLKT